jgi:hypothetical protein
LVPTDSYKYWRAIYPPLFHKCTNFKNTENLSEKLLTARLDL